MTSLSHLSKVLPVVLCLVLSLVGTVSALPSVSDDGFLMEVAAVVQDQPSFIRKAQLDLPGISEGLDPLVASLPRNSQGRLDPSTTRYALHRHFFERRGWRVMGLDPEGLLWNSSSVAEADILDKMPTAVAATIRKRLQAPEGVDARDLPTIAYAFEHFIHDEAVSRLRKVYKITGIPEGGAASPSMDEVRRAVDLFMASSILGYDLSTANEEDVKKLLLDYHSIDSVFPAWHKLQLFVHGKIGKIVAQQSQATNRLLGEGSSLSGLAFVDVAAAVEDVSDGYGSWFHGQCSLIKDKLVQLEDHGTGRVRLSDFYGANVNGGTWQFGESVAYLRQLGALDESNTGNPRVIIPNYINGMSNCLATMDYHTLCCMSECNTLMGHIERSLGKPEATPEDIVTVVRALPSATVLAGRTLSDVMVNRLGSVAEVGGAGVVPIHGRLFAQWMHHAYPRECPYPHFSGTTKPLFLLDWLNETGKDWVASNGEMHAHAKIQRRKDAPVEHAPWVYHEELLAVHSRSDTLPPLWAVVHGATLVPLVAVFALAFGLSRMARTAYRTVMLVFSNVIIATESKIIGPDASTTV